MLADVLTAVQAKLTAAGITSPFQVGRRFLAQKGVGGNRIVVIPNDDTFGAGKTQDFNSKTGPGVQPARITRMAGAEVHVWGVPSSATSPTADLESMAAAEVLLHAFVLQLRAVVRGQWSAVSGHWNNEIRDVGYGQEYILQITADIPVVDVFFSPLPVGTTVTTTPSVAPGNTPDPAEVVS
jgi:hypothetical protein